MSGKSFYVCAFFVLILSLETSYGDVNNILTNPGFESGTNPSPWAARGSGVTISSGSSSPSPHSGTYRGRATGRTLTWHGIQQDVLGKMVVGQTYQMSGWVRISSGSDTVKMTVQKTDGSGTSYPNVATGTTDSNGWTYISGSYTLTVTGTLTQLLVYFETANSATVDIFVDDASVFVPDVNATGNVNVNVRHQVLDGFGAAGAWYQDSVLAYSEPTRTNLFNTMFRDLGLDIYRVRNTYQIDRSYISDSNQIIAAAKTSLGHPIRVMNSSWSPPASLKSNGSTVGGTLKKDAGGSYMYADFAQWWRDSLTAWSNAGVNTYYVNMQNEPDWTASWDTCYFKPTQTDANAGYEEAFAALYTNLSSMPNRPKLLAPEGANISGTPSYVTVLTTTDKSNIYGYSHHLYDGDPNKPDDFISPMTNLKNLIGDSNRPLLQTEFSRGGFTNPWTNAMNLAILMHNALTVEEVSAYLYWELFWASPSGLVSLTTPTPTINHIYYAFKHYSYFTDPNWQRVDANTNSTNLRISAFIDPNNQKLSVIILNTSTTTDMNLNLAFTGFTIVDGNVWRSTSSQNCVLVGNFVPGSIMSVPANSITTLALSSFAPDTAPAVPTGLTADAGYATVVLDWNDNSESDLAGYNVYRSTTSGSGYSKLNGPLLNSSNYEDNTVDHHTTYYYVVTAVDTNSNESGYSNQVFGGLYGDFTGNGIVELDDLALFLDLWLNNNCGDTDGVDLNGDCAVNFSEFAVLAENWQ